MINNASELAPRTHPNTLRRPIASTATQQASSTPSDTDIQALNNKAASVCKENHALRRQLQINNTINEQKMGH